MRLFMQGDTHGDLRTLMQRLKQAREQGITRMWQVGDFGYWTHTRSGRVFLDKVQERLAELDMDLYWNEGNHENYDHLLAEDDVTDDGFVRIRPRIFYSPRGHVFEWAGRRIMSFGGAYSIDKGGRLEDEKWDGPGTHWWPQEQITENQVADAMEKGPIDVMFTHDCPWDVSIPGISLNFWQANENRQLLQRLVNKLRPKLLIGGHYHLRHSDHILWPRAGSNGLDWEECKVEVLDMNMSRYAWGVLDLSAKELRLEAPSPPVHSR